MEFQGMARRQFYSLQRDPHSLSTHAGRGNATVLGRIGAPENTNTDQSSTYLRRESTLGPLGHSTHRELIRLWVRDLIE
jgi:hypothetical protein